MMTTHPTRAADPDDPRVVEALEAYLAELEAGGTPDRAALLAEYTDVAGPLADCLDGLDFLRTAADPLAPAGDTAEFAPVPAELGRLGDFRLVRVIGRGGMGVVYEAEEMPLGRRVAVKTLPDAAAQTPADLRRFQHEARAAACLSHPHIVPVYSVGCDRGVHYFAMRLVRGRSLAELVERSRPGRGSTRPHPGPLAATPADAAQAVVAPDPDGPWPELTYDPRFAAGLALQAAEALAHAHAAGVVHRDVKPANLLLDEVGHLWVVDFGLAYLPGASRLTRTGALVGTLLYMAPEQVDPSLGVVDHRADLYGLGATLYELLTRRPLVEADDHATAVARVLRQRHIPPRALNPAVPRDLETVVLTLLARDPAASYPSARAVADDLRRFLDGRPVLARRPTWSEHAARWAVRHRWAVGAVAAAVLAVAGLQAIGLHRLARERDAKLAERQQAREAVDDLYTHFAERWLAHQPRMEGREREFLLKAQTHYDRLAGADGTPADRLAAATARRRVADITARLGDLVAADREYTAADGQFRRLLAERPGWAEAIREAVICAADHSTLLRQLGRFEDAGRRLAAAAGGFQSLIDGGSTDPFDVAGLAGVENNQGLLWQDNGRPAEAERCHRAARARFARLTTVHPNEPAWLTETASCGHNLADVLAETGRDADAERAYREATTLRERVVEMAPTLPAGRRELARTRTALAAHLRRQGRLPEAARLAAEAADGWGRLAADFPAYPSYAVGLAWAERTVAEIDLDAGRLAAALDGCDRAAAPLRQPVEQGDSSAAGELARLRHLAGTVLITSARVDDARTAFRDTIALAERAGSRTPFDRQTRAVSRLALARLVPTAEAERLLQEAAPDEPPAGPTDRLVWAQVQGARAELARRAGRSDVAVDRCRIAIGVIPAGPTSAETRVALLSGLARAEADRGRVDDAIAHQSEAVVVAGRLLFQADTSIRRVTLAAQQVGLADLLRQAGHGNEAADILHTVAPLLASAPSPVTLARAEGLAAELHATRGEWPAADRLARRAADRLARRAADRLAALAAAGDRDAAAEWATVVRRSDPRPLWAAPLAPRLPSGGGDR